MNAVMHFLTSESGWLLYAALFCLIVLENIIPVLPGDAILVFSAYLVGIGLLRPYFTYFLTVVAAISGFFIVYYAAHFWGRTFVDKRRIKALSPHRMAKIDRHFHRHGYWVLSIGRFIPGTRLAIAFMAGFTRIKALPAVLYTTVSIIGWNFLIFTLGKLAGENRHVIAAFLAEYNHIAILVAVVILVAVIAWRVTVKSKKVENQISG
jgi:membrane protein DedA with SNARE-associated domain